MSEQMDIGQILGELGNGPLLPKHRAKVGTLLKHFNAAGLTLATCADSRHMNRAVSTLQRYCRDFKLSFPDYVPMALRPPKPKKAKRARKS